jgi:outer membrane protein OmpA-like peptidoglycan-associated protein
MADLSLAHFPLTWMGYKQLSSIACSLKKGERPNGGDIGGAALHALANGVVAGGLYSVSGEDAEDSVAHGAMLSLGLAMTMFGVAYMVEPCQTTVGLMPKKIDVPEPIFFEFDKAVILPQSFPTLDKVVAVLKDNPTVTIEVQGHTDNKGTAAYNKKLSDERAAAVVVYLVKKGVAKDRLTSKGYGLEQPIASNDTDEGRSKNRRVEFVRTDK